MVGRILYGQLHGFRPLTLARLQANNCWLPNILIGLNQEVGSRLIQVNDSQKLPLHIIPSTEIQHMIALAKRYYFVLSRQ